MVKSSNKNQRQKVAKKARSKSKTTKQWSQNSGKLKKMLRMNKSHNSKYKNKNKSKRRKNITTRFKFNNKLSLRELKKLHRKRPKDKKLHLNKPENIFNISMMQSLNKPGMDKTDSKDTESKNENEDKIENDASPKLESDVQESNMDIDNNEEKEESITLKISNLPANCEPGTMVELPQQIKVRHWKKVVNTHNQKLIAFNPKRMQSWAHEMYDKKQHKQMKEVEEQLKEEIREDKRQQMRKKKQRDEMRKENILRGTIVKPIRNMHKLKNFTKKQWRSVMKASVEIHNPRNVMRSNYVERQGI